MSVKGCWGSGGRRSLGLGFGRSVFGWGCGVYVCRVCRCGCACEDQGWR